MLFAKVTCESRSSDTFTASGADVSETVLLATTNPTDGTRPFGSSCPA